MRSLPGRRILRQDIDHNFNVIERQGIANLAQLKKQLAAPQKIVSFAAITGIPADYLTILKREIGSLEQKPVPLASFPDLDGNIVSSLNSRGIKTSREYFESGLAGTDELFCLCDLVRINGVEQSRQKRFMKRDTGPLRRLPAQRLPSCSGK